VEADILNAVFILVLLFWEGKQKLGGGRRRPFHFNELKPLFAGRGIKFIGVFPSPQNI